MRYLAGGARIEEKLFVARVSPASHLSKDMGLCSRNEDQFIIIGKTITDGWSGSWKTDWSAIRIVVPGPNGSPLPRLRDQRGKDPLETCTRTWCPR